MESLALFVILPALTGYLFSMKCKVDKSSGETVKFRPPPAVFGIVWAILYVLIGLSWWIAVKDSTGIYTGLTVFLYLLLFVSLNSWIWIYSCKKQKINAIYSLVICIVVTLMCYTVGNTISKLLITPLIGWLLLATLINVDEINKM